MVVNKKIYIELLTSRPLTSREDGNQILKLWERCLPSYLPDQIGNWEPIDQIFDLAERERLLDRWRWPFFAVKRKPRMDSQIFMRKGNMLQHATWMMSFDFSENHLEEIQQFVIEAAKFLEADFGCMMLLTETEVEAGRKNGTVHPLDKKATRFNFIIPSNLLQKYIPDVYWMTILGAPYVEMFGRSKLLSAPVHRAEAIGESIVMFQLTPTIKDGSADPARHGEAKVQLKTFLGENAFFKSGINQECIHPEFVWR